MGPSAYAVDDEAALQAAIAASIRESSANGSRGGGGMMSEEEAIRLAMKASTADQRNQSSRQGSSNGSNSSHSGGIGYGIGSAAPSAAAPLTTPKKDPAVELIAQTSSCLDLLVDVMLATSSAAELSGNELAMEMKTQLENKRGSIGPAIERDLQGSSMVSCVTNYMICAMICYYIMLNIY